MKIYKSKNGDCTLVPYDHDIFLLKYHDNFYKLNREELKKIINIDDFVFMHEIKDNIFIMLFMFFIIAAALFTYFFFTDFKIIDKHFLYANVVLIGNICLHEFGHILFLKFFSKNSKFKIGFKFIFIYPAFYVDTSDSYLLPPYKRAAVYLAGNFMNCLYLLVCGYFFPYITKYNYLVVSAVLINFLPIVKSDGYYVYMALFNKHGYSKSKRKSMLEDFIRGLIMFLFLFGLSKIKRFG
ncbi:MAG: hypothetical protein ACTTI3_08495 [Treponema sp.]